MSASGNQPCALCQTQEGRTLALETRIARVPFNGRIVECARCGLCRVVPTPSASELEQLYLDAVDAYREAGLTYTGGASTAPPYLHERMETLEKYLGRRGRLLDVGAGTGTFLRLASERGWTVAGSERSTASATVLRASGFDIQLGDLTSVSWPAASFDAVHLNHVLEHLPDPAASLRAARRLLRPGGLLALEVPWEFADLPFQLRRRAGWLRPYRVPTQHLWFFSPATLGQLVGAAQFELLTVTTRRDCQDPNPFRRLAKRVVRRMERVAGRGPLIELVARAPRTPDA